MAKRRLQNTLAGLGQGLTNASRFGLQNEMFKDLNSGYGQSRLPSPVASLSTAPNADDEAEFLKWLQILADAQ